MGKDSAGNYSIEITPAKTLYAIAALRAAIEQPEWQEQETEQAVELAEGQEPMSCLSNCATCKYSDIQPDGGWCYMFKEEPHGVCAKHATHSAQLALKPLTETAVAVIEAARKAMNESLDDQNLDVVVPSLLAAAVLRGREECAK
jgi:hypothetical protein